MRRSRIIFALLLAEWLAGATEATANDERSRVERLLTLAAKPSAKNLQAVERYFGSLPVASRNSPLFEYSYAIALIQQRQLQNAARVIYELAEEQPDDLAIRRSKIWLELTLGERARALTDIEALADHVCDHREAVANGAAEMEMVEFCGAVCGFLSGPWSSRVRPDDVQRIEERLRSAHDDEWRAAFDRARTALIERYDALRSAHEENSKVVLASQTKQRDAAKDALGRAAQALDDKQQALKDKQTRRSKDAKAKVTDIDRDLKLIDQKRQALLIQIGPLETQRLALIAQLLPEPVIPPRQMTPVMLANIEHNRPIRQLLATIVTNLTKLETEVTKLNQRELELRLARGTTETKYQVEHDKLAEQAKELDKDSNRINNRTKKLEARSVRTSPRLRAEAGQLTRFSTYVPFPFEREKQRLLKGP
jgi:tetratricopeptide (TPR) repeat protein